MSATKLDLGLVATFVEVVDQSSFSKAGRKLGVTKSTVSRSIARLERAVGTQLLHRTAHRVALSNAGRGLYERSVLHVRALGQAASSLPEQEQELSGELRITAPHDLGFIMLPRLIAAFAARHPLLTFDVRVGNAALDLVAERVDVALRASLSTLADSSCRVRKLSGPNLGFYAAPSYLARRGQPRQVGDPAHDWVGFDSVAASQRPRPSGATAGLRARFCSDDFLVVRELIRAELGVALLPRLLAEPCLRTGELVEVLPHAPRPASGGLFLIHAIGGKVPRKITAFCDFVVEYTRTRIKASSPDP